MAAAGDLFLVSVVGKCFNQRIMFTQFYRLGILNVALTDIEAQDLLASYWDDPSTGLPLDTYLQCLHTDYTCEEIWCQKILPTRARASKGPPTAAAIGNAGAGELSNISAALVMQTDNAGRSQIAVKKIGPLSTGATLIANGELTSVYTDLLEALGQSIVDKPTFSSGDVVFNPVIWHGGTTINSDVITAFHVTTTVRTQHRRVVGLGI